jgi:hypothetical protein
MKKFITVLLLSLLSITIPLFCSAQGVPNLINYQGVLRDQGGTILSGNNTSLRISILKSSPIGPVVFSEKHAVTTNDFGLFNIQIGAGLDQDSSLAEIDWADAVYFLKTEADVSGGIQYQEIGVSQLVAVPYAYHAKTAENLSSTDGLIGPAGPAGPSGINGNDGLPGVTGPQGPQGEPGVDGLNGATGPTGPQGIMGLTGATGAQGAPGINGVTGPQGQVGPTGPSGSPGLWQSLGYSELSAQNDSISVEILPKKHLRVVIRILDKSQALVTSIVFNGGGSSYEERIFLQATTSDFDTETGRPSFRLDGFTAYGGSIYTDMYIFNPHGDYKISHLETVIDESLGSAPHRVSCVGLWNSFEQIDEITVYTGATRTFGTGSFVEVWGHD